MRRGEQEEGLVMGEQGTGTCRRKRMEAAHRQEWQNAESLRR